MGRFFEWVNSLFSRATDSYVRLCGIMISKAGRVMIVLVLVAISAGWLGGKLPSGFIPLEDSGYFLMNIQLPPSASLQRTEDVLGKIGAILEQMPGIQYVTAIGGYNIISQTFTTYNAVVFVSLKPWGERTTHEERYKSIIVGLNQKLSDLPEASVLAVPPPAIPGVGITAGVSFLLEDRTG
ncbi:MAG: hydrophobe/amphiphile efflux-1 family RND transporter, partial [Deltaproteobacteria bacterium]|nr:hydrophobe/amphiphile efflux-1 family RND transporter [Deltaproteobacteria bacterium]